MRRLALLAALLASAAPAQVVVSTGRLTVPGQRTAVAVVPPTLGALALTPLTATAGAAYSGTLSGGTVGSALAAAACSDGSVPALSGLTVSITFAAAGSPTCPVTEILAGATGSPRTTTFAFTVAAATPAASLDFSDPNNSQYLPVLL